MFRKKSVLRALVGLTAGAAIVVGTAGCSSDAGSANGADGGSSSGLSGDLTVSFLSGNTYVTDTLDAFRADNPDLNVRDLQSDSNNYQAQIRAQLDGGQGPDAVYIWTGSGNAMAAQILGGAGKLEDLSGESWAKDMDPAAKTLVSLDGKMYGLTTVANPYGYFFNTDKMEELGITPPSTFSELIDTCKAVRKKDSVLIALGAQTGYLAYGIPAQLANSIAWTKDKDYLTKLGNGEGGTWTDSQIWNDSLTEALDEYQQMLEAGCFQDDSTGYSSDAAYQMVASGQAVGTYIISAGLPSLKAAAPDIAFDFATLPATENPEDLVLTVNPGAAFGVSASAKNPEAAKALLDFMAQPEQQALEAKTNFGLPYTVSDSVTIPDELAGAGDLYKAGDVLLFPTALWPNPEVKQTIIAECQNLLTGTQDVDGVVKAVRASFDGK